MYADGIGVKKAREVAGKSSVSSHTNQSDSLLRNVQLKIPSLLLSMMYAKQITITSGLTREENHVHLNE
jgi:hypothetical protein